MLVGTIGTARDISQKIENERFLELYVENEMVEWSKTQAESNARIQGSLDKLHANIVIMRETL
jgi:hypothetical protein